MKVSFSRAFGILRRPSGQKWLPTLSVHFDKTIREKYFSAGIFLRRNATKFFNAAAPIGE
jgi:hypothetical protein